LTEHIRFAEDEPYIVESLSFVLGQAGYKVTSESDGAQVIDAVRGSVPRVVVLDLMLPGRNGLQILKDLKNDPDLKRIPVLILTAKGQSQDRVTADQLGADAFITKPFSNREVLDCVGSLVRGVEATEP